MIRLMSLTLVVVPLVAWPAVGHADDDPDEEIARRHYAAGREAYATRSYQRAIDEFEIARRYRPAPELDFNIARSYDRLERFAEAIVAYQRYLASGPPEPDATEVRTRIEVLQRRLADPGSPAATATAVGPGARGPRRFAAPLAVAGVTLALAITGAALVASVAPGYNDLVAHCVRPCMDRREPDLKTRAYAGYALFGLAGAAAVVDVALFIVAARRGRARPLARGVSPLLSGAAVETRF
jgi:tetratricopeptide (TPR) repeat protein